MNYDFFANKSDKIKVFDLIFNYTELQVFDLGSPYGQEINQYKSTAEIANRFDLENGRDSATTLNLWAPNFDGSILFRKVELDPKRCNGYTYRYRSEGWGLIQLYLGGITDNILFHSHIGHFNEKGALKWENTDDEKGKVNLWNWKAIEQTSRKLKYQIHNKMSVKQIGSYGIMQGADDLNKSGTNFFGV